MNSDIIPSLISNAALLVALSTLYAITYSVPLKQRGFIDGIIVGIVGIAIMSMPLYFSPGIIFDTRSILLSVTGLFFGLIPTIIAASLTALYRILLGGAGVWAGLSTIIVTSGIGLLSRRYLLNNTKYRTFKFYLFGFITSLAMLLCMLALPKANSSEVLKSISLPVLLIYPLATVLMSMLLIHQKERNENIDLITEAEQRYKSLFYDNTAVMLLINPEDGSIIDANKTACTYYGWPIETIKTMKIWQINTLSPEQVNIEMSKSASFKKNHFLFKHRKASGETADVEVYSGPLIIKGKTLIYSIIHDISERVVIEKELQESENRFRMLVEGAPDATIYIQTEMKFAYVNEATRQLFGADSKEQLIGTSVMERFHPQYRNEVLARIHTLNTKKQKVPPLQQIYLKLDGSMIHVDVTAVPITYENKDGAMVFVRDITERIKMEQEKIATEAQMRQQQKLEAIGTLAGGVAHEINNPINGIMNYAQLILDSAEPNSTSENFAREIINETKRISTIVKNLLQFSRQEKQTHSLACMDDIINQTLSLINTIIRKDQITLNINIPSDLPKLKCRSQQIQQVLMNLLTNARDALNQKYPGYHENKIIELNCKQHTINERRYIRITVKDNGMGIDKEIQEKIFEPFFSTKPKDKGTGLGLSISFGIVKEHHGMLSLETEEGNYTCFHLDLPIDNGWSVQSVN